MYAELNADKTRRLDAREEEHRCLPSSQKLTHQHRASDPNTLAAQQSGPTADLQARQPQARPAPPNPRPDRQLPPRTRLFVNNDAVFTAQLSSALKTT